MLQQKPLALEAMILSAINKTASWLKSKTETEIADLLRTARTPTALSTSQESNARGKSKDAKGQNESCFRKVSMRGETKADRSSASEWALAN